ncbi:hypothetical protein ACXYX3_06635 [Mycobacterium sp. C3-094]
MEKFDERAAEYALYQRTKLLPDRRNGKILNFAEKLHLRQSYGSFVRTHASRNSKEILRSYDDEMLAEYERRAKFIPDHGNSILDIGCGLASIDYHIYNRMRGDGPMIYLLDRTSTEQQVWYRYEARGAFYNSLELAKTNLMLKGVPENRVICIDAPEDGHLNLDSGSLDFVISTISWGFHYPIALYLESVWRVMSAGGVLLVDVRKGTNGYETLKQKFGTAAEIVDEAEKHFVVRCVKL